MSSAPIHHLRASFSPVEHYQPRRAPIERLERSADLLGARPDHPVTYTTAAASALSGPNAAQQDNVPAAPLLAPGSHFDAYA